jgi:hypothetical protein
MASLAAQSAGAVALAPHQGTHGQGRSVPRGASPLPGGLARGLTLNSKRAPRAVATGATFLGIPPFWDEKKMLEHLETVSAEGQAGLHIALDGDRLG